MAMFFFLRRGTRSLNFAGTIYKGRFLLRFDAFFRERLRRGM